MKEFEKKYFIIAKYIFFVGVALIFVWIVMIKLSSIWGAIKKIYDILLPFVYGFVFAYLLKSIVNWMERHIFVFINKTPKIDEKDLENKIHGAIEKERKKICINNLQKKKKNNEDISLEKIELEPSSNKKVQKLVKLYVQENNLCSKEEKNDFYLDKIEKLAIIAKKEVLLEEKKKQRKKYGRILSISLTYLLLFLFISGIIYILVPSLINAIKLLIQQVPQYYNQMEEYMDWLNTQSMPGNFSIPTMENIKIWLENYVSQLSFIVTDSFPWFMQKLAGITSGIFTIIIGVVISIYMLFNKEVLCKQIKKVVCAWFSKETAQKIIKVSNMVDDSFGGFISSRIITSILIGIICYIGMRLLNLPHAILISVLVAITNPLPYVGPFISGIPSALLILMSDPIKAIIFIIFIIILQQLEGNVLSVIITGKKVGMSAFWVIFSVMLGGGLFGIWGMFIGVPFFAVFYALGGETIREKLKKKGCLDDIEQYLDEE